MYDEESDFLTVKELAKRWKKNEQTIYRWRKSKENFPHTYRGSFKGIMFKIQDVIKYENEIMRK